MLSIKKHLKLFALLGCSFFAVGLRASTSDRLAGLEAEMLKHIGTNDRDAFNRAAEKLKAASREEYDERMFYKAWGNQAIYDATHKINANGLDVVEQMTAHARQEGSIYGDYAAMHTKGMIQLQMGDNDEAEKAFLEALDFHRRHFPNESAAEDLRELMKIAYVRGDNAMAKEYGYQVVAEPNVDPHHKGRVLSRLSIMAFDENNADEFNQIHDEMKRLAKTDNIVSTTLFDEVNFCIINGDFKRALILADKLSADTCAERKAIIYHRLGDNTKAYEYMVLYKHISDSIQIASHNSTVANLYLRLNNERLMMEQELMVHQNGYLRYRFYLAIGAIVILILLFIIYQRHRIIKLLKQDNSMLDYGRKGAENALKNINELSYYESQTALPLTSVVKVNKLCDHLTSLTQRHCHKAVITVFLTDFEDDFEIITNAKALETLLTHLLNTSALFTLKGFITLKCIEAGSHVRFVISDTSLALSNKSKNHLPHMFTEQDETVRHISMNFNICQSICRLLYGRIWRDETYTDGTQFCFEIPKVPSLTTKRTA